PRVPEDLSAVGWIENNDIRKVTVAPVIREFCMGFPICFSGRITCLFRNSLVGDLGSVGQRLNPRCFGCSRKWFARYAAHRAATAADDHALGNQCRRSHTHSKNSSNTKGSSNPHSSSSQF